MNKQQKKFAKVVKNRKRHAEKRAAMDKARLAHRVAWGGHNRAAAANRKALRDKFNEETRLWLKRMKQILKIPDETVVTVKQMNLIITELRKKFPEEEKARQAKIMEAAPAVM